MIFPMEYIPFLNITVILLFILFIVSGYRNGFLLKVLGCLSLIVVALIAWFIAPLLGSFLHVYPKSLTPLAGTIAEGIFYDLMNRMMLFAIIFLILAVATLFLKPIFKTISAIPLVSEVNKLLGVIFGFLQALILVSVISLIFQTPLFANGSKINDDSYLSMVSNVTNKVLFFASDRFDELKSIQKIVTPNSELDELDINRIHDWLKDQGVEEGKIQEFILSLHQQ